MLDDLSEKLITHYVGGTWRAPLATVAQPVTLICGRIPGLIVPAGAADVARSLVWAEAAQAALSTAERRAEWLAAFDTARPALLAALDAAQTLERGAPGGIDPATDLPTAPGPLALLLPAAMSPAAQAGMVRAALAAARPVIIKPAPGGAVSATVLMDHLHRLGLPPGAVAMLQGDGPGTGAVLEQTPGLRTLRLTAR